MIRDNDFNGFPFFEDIHGGSSVSYDDKPSSPAQPFVRQQPLEKQQVSSIDLKNVLVYEPTNFSDVEVLIDYLKSKQPAIVNLDNASPETAQRVLDFTSGAIYALSGSVVRISGNIFLLSPEGVGITFPQELAKK